MTKPTPRSQSPSKRTKSPNPKANGKGKGKGKAAPVVAQGQGAPVTPAVPATGQNGGQQKKFGGMSKLWCPFFLKGKCTKGDKCTFPHISEEAKQECQRAIRVASGQE